jgi:signal transduction histidine kinase
LQIAGERDLPADVTLAFYRITQEALNNAIKHAEATTIDIALAGPPDRVELRVRDDGRGFDPQSIPAGHLGLSIMRERAAKIGASMQIESKPGQGTTITAIWSDSQEKATHD